MNKMLIAKLYAGIDALIERGALESKRVILFGANKTSDLTCSYLRAKKTDVFATIDNNPAKWGETISGVPILSPADALDGADAENVIILIASKYWREMVRSVEKYGVSGENFAQTLVFAEYSSSEGAFQKAAGKVLEGCDIYRRIKDAYGEDAHILIIPESSMGDAFFIFAYFAEYKRQNPTKNCVFTITGVASEKVAEMFGNIPYTRITQEESNKLWAFCSFMDIPDAKIVSYAVPHTNVLTPFYGYGKLNWGEMIREIVLGLPRNAPKTLPHTTPKTSETFSCENAGAWSKTVIIAPYAVTAQSLPDTFWNALSEALIESGYSVRVNQAPDESAAIKGASPLFIPLEHIAQAAGEAAAFISLRSGICDVLSASSTKSIIIYPDKDFYGFFGLLNIGVADCAANLTEIIYKNDSETVKRVMDALKQCK